MIFYLPPNIPLLEIELVTRPGRCPQIVAACVSVVAVVLFVAIFVVCRSWRRERVKKKQAIANAHAVTQWTKKVIIGKHNFYSAVRSGFFFFDILPRSCLAIEVGLFCPKINHFCPQVRTLPQSCAFMITFSAFILLSSAYFASEVRVQMGKNHCLTHLYKKGTKIHLSTLWAFRTSSVSDIGQQWGWCWCGGAHHPD